MALDMEAVIQYDASAIEGDNAFAGHISSGNVLGEINNFSK